MSYISDVANIRSNGVGRCSINARNIRWSCNIRDNVGNMYAYIIIYMHQLFSVELQRKN